MISANHPRFSCTSDMSLTIYGKIFSGPLVHTNDPSGTGVNVASVSRYDFRNNHNYVIQRRRTELFAKSFIPSSTELWNQLPKHIRDENTLLSFKKSLNAQCFCSISISKVFLNLEIGNYQLFMPV